MLETVLSKNGVHIRLTNKRWAHIVEEHNELAGLRAEVLAVLSEPIRIVAGDGGELLAISEQGTGRWLVVAYREASQDGFIITAFSTTKIGYFERRRQVWP